jgi:hypothetical protein
MGEPRITVLALVVELGVTDKTIRKYARLAGLSPTGGYTPEQAEAIRAVRRDRRERIPAWQLAAELGVAAKTLRQYARRLGIDPARGYTRGQAGRLRAVIGTSPRLVALRRSSAGRLNDVRARSAPGT